MSRQSDHDRALERLLRAMPSEPATTAACVDAERLAAWSEGGLSLSERESIDAHLASCARCLAMLAVFTETHVASVSHEGAVPHEGSVSHEGSVPLREQGQAPRVGLTPRGTPILRPRFWRSPTRWLVPITTAAAAVLIWMVLPARPPAPAFAPTTQVARDEVAQAPAPVPERLDDARLGQTRENTPRSGPTAQAPAGAASAPTQSQPAERATEGERRRQTERAQEFARVAEEPAAKASDSATVAQRGANEAMSDRMAAAAPPATAPAPMPAAPPPAALMRAEAATVEIRSPDPTFRWRIRGGVVERSITGGSSWQPAVTPSGATVTAGTSPSPSVCWLVGPNGTVLRTTDGSRFEAVTISGAGALASVRATDANRATVTGSDGSVHVTTDGGRNWTR